MANYATFSVGEAIIEAFERILIQQSRVDAEKMDSAFRSIRLLLEDWDNDDVKLWRVVSSTQVTTESDSDYTLTAGAIDVIEVYLRRDGIDTPMAILSRSQWFAIPDKDEEGRPDRIWVDRSQDPPVMNVWPVPENSTDTIVYNYLKKLQDSSTVSSGADVPSRWNEAFVSGLTAKLAEKWARPLLAEKMSLAGAAYSRAKIGERERGATVMRIRRGLCGRAGVVGR